MKTIGLVACGKSKRPGTHPARSLYTGVLFRKALAYSEATYDLTFILSAWYGLVGPDEVLESYDFTLADKPWVERSAWAERVHCQGILRGLDDSPEDRIHFHAGAAYREPLNLLLGLSRCVYPVAGLGIGRQLAWYTERGF